jgi:tetratricopeptide (TPR) repeat protein
LRLPLRFSVSFVLSLMAFIFVSLAGRSAARADVSADDLLKSGKPDEALRLLNTEVQTHPSNAEAYNLLCRVYYQLESWDTSLRMAEKSVSLEPRNSAYHQWLGRAAGRKAENSNPFTAFGLARRVRAEFEKAVALDGNNISARSDLAEYYMEAPGFLGGDKGKARQQADAVAAHDPGLASYIYARVEEKQGSGRAEQQFKKAIAASGDSARYWVELAHYYKRAARPADMEAAINRSLSAPNHDGVPEYDAASLLLDSGRNFPLAIKILRSYLSGDDPSEDGPAFHAHYLLGKLQEKQGDREAAAAEYRTALSLASQFRPARDALARVSR